jgi:hypothetical protein
VEDGHTSAQDLTGSAHRKLLVVGAHSVLFHRKQHTNPPRMWAKKLMEKKPFNLVAVALANKMARITFAIMRGTTVIGKFRGKKRG